MNRDDVIDVLTVVAAATRRTVGEADVKIWREVIGDDDKQLALKAVRDHLRECPGVWLEPGHIHQRVRAKIRDEIARESQEVRDQRQAQIDARLAPRIREIEQAVSLPVDPKFKRRSNPALAVPCPYCKAAPGRACISLSTGKPLAQSPAHPGRVERAQEQAHA